MVLTEEIPFPNNSSKVYNQELKYQLQLKECSDQLAIKVTELSFLETEYIKLKTESKCWRHKFEYVFKENELLSMEISKLDAAYKQIVYLQQEVAFKEQESDALRCLVTALENNKDKIENKEKKNMHINSLNYEAELNALQIKYDILEERMVDKDAHVHDKEMELLLLQKRINELEEKLKDALMKNQQSLHIKDSNRSNSLLHETKNTGLETKKSIQERRNTVLERRTTAHERKNTIHERRNTVHDNPITPVQCLNNEETDPILIAMPQTPKEVHSNLMEWIPSTNEIIGDSSIDPTSPQIRHLFVALDTPSQRKNLDLLENVVFQKRITENVSIILEDLEDEIYDEIIDILLPLLKYQCNANVSYSTRRKSQNLSMMDIKIDLEYQNIEKQIEDSRLLDRNGIVGCGHSFYGISNDDSSKLILHDLRYLHPTKALYISKPLQESDQNRGNWNTEDTKGKKGKFGLTKRFVGHMMGGMKGKVNATVKKNFVHENSTCSSCLKTPITGGKWTCSVCDSHELCDNCYGTGMHGFEQNEEIFSRVQEITWRRCPRLEKETELLGILRSDICKMNLRKYQFCLEWIADIIIGKCTLELKARALEIPSIQPELRARFINLLSIAVSNRTDIKVNWEWQLDPEGTGREDDKEPQEVLRIWVTDQYKSTSPFLNRHNAEYRDEIDPTDDESDEEINYISSNLQ